MKHSLPFLMVALLLCILSYVAIPRITSPAIDKGKTSSFENWKLAPNEFVILHESEDYVLLFRSNGELLDTIYTREKDVFTVRLTDEGL